MSPLQPSPALLPSGFADRLPPYGEHEAAIEHKILTCFAQHGYVRVSPPLIEFEESLLSGTGGEMAQRSFRLMDPATQRMLAVRADMTIQIARIAATRLADVARPLRLAYAGDVVHAKAHHHKPERQFTQIGCELIGTLSPIADTEVIQLAAASMQAIGITDISIDLALPTLLTTLLAETDLSVAQKAELRLALDRKDKSAAATLVKGKAEIALRLLDLCGKAQDMLQPFANLKLPAAAEPDRQRLLKTCEALGSAIPLTLDFVEWRGFEYESGLSFTVFSSTQSIELGRGGRYRAKGPQDTGEGEPAVGLTFYADALAHTVPLKAAEKRLYLPHGTPASAASQWQAQGWATVRGCDPERDAKAAAKGQGCTHILTTNQPAAL